MSGWYPDPGGQRGAFRYWDGQRWSSELSPTPSAPPPRPSPPTPGGGSSRRGLWWLVIAGAVLIALILIAVFAIRSMRVVGADPLPSNYPTASQNPCPEQPSIAPTPPPQRGDGRVSGGRLSFPQLGSPFGSIETDARVPFGRDIARQEAPVEPNYRPGQSWVASVLVGELTAGDGFYSPQNGAEIVARCVVGVFYGDAKVDRDDQVSKAATIDGHDAWILESHLTFDIRGLQTKGELMILAVVELDVNRGGLYYASIPDTTPELVQPARDAMAGLTVDG